MSFTGIETRILGWLAAHGLPAQRKRARQLLEGSAGPVLRDQFAAQRLAAFRPPALFVDELGALAEIDQSHARQVADHALALFDCCAGSLGLTSRHRRLLEIASILHNIGVVIDEPRHHLAGRDLLLAIRLLDVTPVEQHVIACAIRFHRKAVRPREEPLLGALPASWQMPTLALCALLRIADGLDYSTTQSTRLVSADLTDEGLSIRVKGPHAAEDAARAQAKSDAWAAQIGGRLSVQVEPDLADLAQTPLTAQTPLLAACHRGIADQLLRWQAARAGAEEDDQRDLKALRAAARRSNAALGVFGVCFKRAPSRALRARLKEAEKALGDVRDWDLTLDEAEEAFEGAENGLLRDWQRQRRKARKRANAWFRNDADSLRHDLERFLIDAPLRADAHVALSTRAQTLLVRPLKRLRRAFARLDRDDALPALHQVRLALKRVRFTIEFLTPFYGAAAEQILPAFIRAQDRLGGINDLHVAHNRVLDYLSRYPGDPEALDYARLLAAQIKKQLNRADADLQPLRPDVLAVEFGRWPGAGDPTSQSTRAAVVLEPESELA